MTLVISPHLIYATSAYSIIQRRLINTVLPCGGTFLIESSTNNSQPKIKAPRQALGRTGERLAADALTSRGYRILERNFRCSYGEIDLVAEDATDLVFVEVKTRRGTAYGRPEEAVTLRKQRKLLELATYYLDFHACSERSWRIDIVAVQLSVHGKLEEIRLCQHAVTDISL